MLRPRTVRPLAISTGRLFSTAPRVMSAGDTGSGFSRPQGERAGDAFTKRERSAEEMYIRQEEMAKLKALKEKMAAHRKHMDELEKHIDELTARQGGEQN